MNEVFGDYELIDRVGRGGMGEVFRARKAGHQRIVALKRLPRDLSDDRTFVARFRHECDTVAGLEHPNIVPVYDYGEADGHLFIAMRLIDGRDLAEEIAAGPIDVGRAVHIISQVAAALDFAHKVGVEHRDVKPNNIMIAASPSASGGPVAYLVDFGIARSPDMTSLTEDGTAVGSAPFMSPERIVGKDADKRADVYALACVLYTAVTGGPPFPREETNAIWYAHLNTPMPRVSLQVDGVPSALDDVIIKGAAKDPALRYATAGDLAADARSAIAGARPNPSPTKDQRFDTTVVSESRTPWPIVNDVPQIGDREPTPPRPRRRWLGLVAAAVVLAICAGAILLFIGTRGHAGKAAGESAGAGSHDVAPPTPQGSSPDASGSSSPSGTPTTTRATVGTCLSGAASPVSCEAAHASEVVSTGSVCTLPATITYLGGVNGTDVLLSTVQVTTIDTSAGTVCAVHGPQAGSTTGSARNILQSSRGDSWRLCADQQDSATVACSRPHTVEYVYAGSLSPGHTVDCDAQASIYLGADYANFSDMLDARRATSGNRVSCAVVVRGGDVLTSSVRLIGTGELPLEPRSR